MSEDETRQGGDAPQLPTEDSLYLDQLTPQQVLAFHDRLIAAVERDLEATVPAARDLSFPLSIIVQNFGVR